MRTYAVPTSGFDFVGEPIIQIGQLQKHVVIFNGEQMRLGPQLLRAVPITLCSISLPSHRP